MKRLILTIFVFVLSTAIIAQENNCPTFERAAVAEAIAWCADLETGQACYGNSGISADIVSDAAFNLVGERADLTEISQIRGITEDNRYGIALIQTTGYAPDNWMPQSVALAVSGDVIITNTGNEGINIETVSAEIIGEQGANIRSGVTTDYRVITSLFEGDTVKLTGRFRDDSYYRVQLPDGETGWIASGAVDVDVSNLAIVDLEDSPPQQIYAPYTAFSLQTGIDDAACSEVWESGVLLQSPELSPVRILVNDISVTITGTVFLQADSSRTLFHVIEGQLSYQNEIVEEGYTLAVFESDFSISPYAITEFAPLPTEILPRYSYIGVELSTIVTPAPQLDRSPIADVLVDAPCVITTGVDGANFRAGPGGEFIIRDVLAYRETVHPIGRAIGSDGLVWYELAQNLWVSSQVVVTGGDCFSVPDSTRIPVPLPTATPEN